MDIQILQNMVNFPRQIIQIKYLRFNLKTQYLSNNGLVVKVWDLPKLDINSNTEFSKELPFSAIEVGLCAQR